MSDAVISPRTVRGLESTDQITMLGDGKAWMDFGMELDYDKIRGAGGVPARVARGVFRGFSLPIYAADDQELFYCMPVPPEWDEASDILVYACGWLTNANNAKRFNLQLSWEHFEPTVDVVPATSNDVEVETLTGNVAAFQSYFVSFTIDYDIDGGGSEVAYGEGIQLRLRRIAASANEIAGEFVVIKLKARFISDKLGVAV